jgi:hypothetical protein
MPPPRKAAAPSDRSFDAFVEALPSILAAQDLRYVVNQIVGAAGRRGIRHAWRARRKVGLGPLLIALMRRRAITMVAMNGSAAIHDFELAAYGGTSEDVAAGLGDGTFGMAEETGREMNAALARGAKSQQGAGEAFADYLGSRQELPGRDVSVLLACAELCAGHRARGDRRRNHSSASQRRRPALGATSHRDFKRLAGAAGSRRRRRRSQSRQRRRHAGSVPQGPDYRAQSQRGRPKTSPRATATCNAITGRGSMSSSARRSRVDAASSSPDTTKSWFRRLRGRC